LSEGLGSSVATCAVGWLARNPCACPQGALTLPDHKRRRYSAVAPAFGPAPPVALLRRSRGGTPPLRPPTFTVLASVAMEPGHAERAAAPYSAQPHSSWTGGRHLPPLATGQKRWEALTCNPASLRLGPEPWARRLPSSGSAASWLFKFTAKPHFPLEHCTACVLLPNVRAEAPGEAGRLWPAADNGACDCRLPAKGGLPRRVASRARG
jgi:hypothetical protein